MPSPRASLFVTAALAAALSAPAAALAEAPRVVTTIKPVHSLTAAVMAGVGEPQMLLPPGASPHDYALKPSDARAIDQAQVVFWIGAPLEGFFVKPVQSLGGKARVVALASAPDLLLLPTRTGGAWDEHDHDHDHDHGHDHAPAAKPAAHDHDHDHAHAAAADDDHHDHEHVAPLTALSADAAALPAEVDGHIWLDPRNGAAMARTIAAVLAEADAANADTYRANAERLAAELAGLEQELKGATAAAAGKPYIVFHDAYHYFEHRFGLTPAGSITVEPGRPVGAKRVSELRAKVGELNATCVFAEPQFEPRLVTTITEGTSARAGVLDPLGTDIPPGPAMYPQLLRALATSLTDCLAGNG
ncbi:zinc ABC transporter substrate-binding protein [Caenispirillum bisanense]|uniref:zinc ABC transporter substrate-binding protein n=1 Tax=Caenispirillum bisanense TaxID=414052 RepID=UPI0031D148FF